MEDGKEGRAKAQKSVDLNSNDLSSYLGVFHQQTSLVSLTWSREEHVQKPPIPYIERSLMLRFNFQEIVKSFLKY